MNDATGDPLGEGPPIEEREARLSGGARALAGRSRQALSANPHLLLAVSATLMTTGIAAIVLGWLGVARSTMVEQQLAYVVSGGLLGLALATIGALAFFTHWLTVLIRTNREQTELLRELRDRGAERQRDLETRLAALERPPRASAVRKAPARRRAGS